MFTKFFPELSLLDALEEQVQTNLVALRKAAGLSQKQVESQLGLRANTLYDLEKGRLRLTFVQAVTLCELYHADLHDLLKGAETSALSPMPESDEASHPARPSVSSLTALGVISGGIHPFAHAMAQDPVIVAEVGVGQMGKKTLMELLLGELTSTQRRYFVLDLYRYINSVISSDGEIRETEVSLRDTLIEQSQVMLSESEKKSIARAFRKPYFGKSMTKSLPRDAYRHFLIWTLQLVAHCDGQPHYETQNYIRQVAEHIRLPVSAFRFIEEQIESASLEEN